MTEKLDNPVWHSLSESHKDFSITYYNSKFYLPDHCPFGAFQNVDDISMDIDQYSRLTDNFFIVGRRPGFSDKIILKNELVCLQMVIEKKVNTHKETIVKLSDGFQESLYDLVNLVQPGYFRKKTALMGDYFGIFQDGKLVAASGERMKMDYFTEVSAVVTHPHYTGRGYARQLVAYTVNKILDENKIPFLHVAETNKIALQLYDNLNFRIRRKISFWHLIKDDNSIHLG